MAKGIVSRSLLLDGAFFVRNVAQFPSEYFIGSAPSAPLFYALARGLEALFGRAEWVYRVVPLAYTVAGVVLLAMHLIRQYTKPVVLVSVCLLALSCPLVNYAANAHTFAADFFATTVLLLTAFRLFENFSTRHWIAWLALAGLCLLFSFPALFTTFACAATLTAMDIKTGRGRILRIKLAGLAVLSVFAAALVFSLYLRQATGRNDLNYWSVHFPASRHPLALAKFAYLNTLNAVGFLFFNGQNGLAGLFLAFLGGAFLIHKGRTPMLAACGTAIGITVLAAALQKWPYGAIRTVLFLVPAFLLPMAEGLELAWNSTKRRGSKALVGCAMASLVIPQTWVLKLTVMPAGDSEEAVKTLSRSMAPEIRDTDRFLVYYSAEVQFLHFFKDRVAQAVYQT
jgi:hypothetical protein